MQIICNNCGNDLTFPNEQHLVTCPQCLTTMEIEESEYIITAKTIETPIVDESIFQESNGLMQIQSVDALYDLLKLEEVYNAAVDKYFSQQIISGNKFRPTFIRGFFQVVLGIVIIIYFFHTASNLSQQNLAIPLILVLGIYFIQLGIKECIRWWKFRQFERDYFEEQRSLIDLIASLNLPNNLVNCYADYKDNLDSHLDIREKYFYIKIFKRKVNIGASKISNAIGLITLGLFFGFILAGYVGFYFTSFWITMIGSISLFFIMLSKSRRYRKTYSNILEDRDEIISLLKETLNQ